MRVFATVLVAFTVVGCTGSAPTVASSSAFRVPPSTPPPGHTSCDTDPLCAITFSLPPVGDSSLDNNPWQSSDPPAGYVLWSVQDYGDGLVNVEVFGYSRYTDFKNPQLSDQIWTDTVQPSTLSHYQTMPGTMPFVAPAAPAPSIEPAAIPVQGGDEGVGQVGSVDVPLGTNGNEPGALVYLDIPTFQALQGYQCVAKATTKAQICGTANCGEVVDDCNVPYSCGSCNGDLVCLSGHCILPHVPPNPPCVGKCI